MRPYIYVLKTLINFNTKKKLLQNTQYTFTYIHISVEIIFILFPLKENILNLLVNIAEKTPFLQLKSLRICALRIFHICR